MSNKEIPFGYEEATDSFVIRCTEFESMEDLARAVAKLNTDLIELLTKESQV